MKKARCIGSPDGPQTFQADLTTIIQVYLRPNGIRCTGDDSGCEVLYCDQKTPSATLI